MTGSVVSGVGVVLEVSKSFFSPSSELFSQPALRLVFEIKKSAKEMSRGMLKVTTLPVLDCSLSFVTVVITVMDNF